MKKNLILCLLLALAMMVSLTACQVEIPGIGTVNINDGSTGGNAGGDNTIHTGSDNDESLALLRKSMAEVPDYIFAAAYISSAAGGPDDFELPIQEWVSKAAPELCAQYPFVRNIPRERVVGSGGSLFCVVPRDPNASVVVNRIQWNEKAGGYDNVEVLYRSESGEPFLVFACADMGEATDPDTEVIVTNSGEDPLKWYPYYGIVALPYSPEDGRELGYDFTVYTGNDMPIASAVVAFLMTSPLPMWTAVTDGSWGFLLGGVLLYALRGHRPVQLGVWALNALLWDLVLPFAMVCRQDGFVWTQMFTAYYEWFGVGAVVLMLLYNGQRGSGHKQLFYWFYPAHIYLLYGASCLLYNVMR